MTNRIKSAIVNAVGFGGLLTKLSEYLILGTKNSTLMSHSKNLAKGIWEDDGGVDVILYAFAILEHAGLKLSTSDFPVSEQDLNDFEKKVIQNSHDSKLATQLFEIIPVTCVANACLEAANHRPIDNGIHWVAELSRLAPAHIGTSDRMSRLGTIRNSLQKSNANSVLEDYIIMCIEEASDDPFFENVIEDLEKAGISIGSYPAGLRKGPMRRNSSRKRRH